MKIYIATPISGYSYDEIKEFYQSFSTFLKSCGYEILSPMTAKGILRNEIEFRPHGYDNPVCTNHAIFERDKWMVSNSDVVFVYLRDDVYISIGCMMELAWASLLGKHSVVVMDEESAYKHAFVLEAADIVFYKIDDALEYLEKLVDNKFND